MVSHQVLHQPAQLVLPENLKISGCVVLAHFGTVEYLVRYTMLQLPEALRADAKIVFGDSCWGYEAIAYTYSCLTL